MVTLSFLDRQAYVRGTDELTADLKHSMEDEWMRGDPWTDWAGVEYTGISVWDYVNGPAKAAKCTPGLRDQGANDGLTLEGFLERANAKVRQRKPNATKYDLLSKEEILGVRLCT